MINATVASALIERNASAIATVAKMDNSTSDMSLYSLGGNYIGIIRYNFSTSTVTKEIDVAQIAAGYTPTISGNSTLVVQNIGFMYFRFGGMMLISGRFNITNKGDGTGSLRISLPTGFTITTGSVGSYGTITPNFDIENRSTYASMSMRGDANADNIFVQYGAGSNSIQYLQPGYHMIFAVVPVTKTS